MLIYDGSTELILSNFNNNGLGYLKDFRSNPKIIKYLNGNFQLIFEYVKSGINSEYLKELNIIKSWHDNDWELFRIQKVIQKRNSIEVLATQLALFDLSNNFLEDVRPTNLSGVNALQYLLDNTQTPKKFNATGDNAVVNTAYYVRKNVIEAIVSSDNSLVNRWNGEVDYHLFNVGFYNKIGNDNNVFIQYGKNLKDFNEDIDVSTIITRIMPIGAEELILPEKYVDSPRINDYPFIFIKTITFSDIVVNENTTTEEAYQQLRERCQKLFEQGIDLPSINVKVDWQDLSKTLEYYEKYNVLERIRLGDTVTLKTDIFTYKTRVIKTVYDVLLKKYTNFELGNEKTSFISESQNVITNVIDSIGLNPNSLLQKAQDNATKLITSAMGGYVYKTQGELFIMDTDNPNTATNVWRWNLNGLGYSSTGINGPYGIAITQDGQIVADYITTGQMSVNRITGLTDEIDGIYSTIQLNNSNITSTIQQTGGNNKLHNTKWYQNLYDWEVGEGTTYSIIENAETEDNTQSKRELHISGGGPNPANLFDASKIVNMGIGATSILLVASYRSYYFPCKPNTLYSAKRATPTTSRFNIGFTRVVPNSGTTVYNLNPESASTNQLNQDVVIQSTSPNDAQYCFVYLSSNSQVIPDVMINEGEIQPLTLESRISQPFNQILNNEYTVTFKYKKDTNTRTTVKIKWNATDELVLLDTDLAMTERKEISITYNALSTSPIFEISGEIYIVDLVINDGISKIWSRASDEQAGLNYILDINGNMINDINQTDNYTRQTPMSFDVYRSNNKVAFYSNDLKSNNAEVTQLKNGPVIQIGGKFFYTGGN